MRLVKISRFLWGFILFFCVFLFSAQAGASEKMKCIVGYSVKSMVEVDSKDAEAALKVWSRELGNQFGFEVETSLYQSVDTLIKDFTSKRVDLVVITTLDFLGLAPVLKVKPELTLFKNDKGNTKYLLVTKSEFQKNGLAGLKSKKLATLKTNHLGMLFLNTELLKAKHPEADIFFSSVQEKTKESQAVLDVFFGQADACIVSEIGFKTMVELNPQIGRKLQVMSSSPDLVETVGFFRPDYPPAYKEKAIKGMQEIIKNHERGKQIMLLFNTDKMDFLKIDDLNNVKKMLAEYRQLKGMKKF